MVAYNRNKWTLHRVWVGVLRRATRTLKPHPSSYPYISGDTFRSIADHVYDKDKKFNPSKVKRGEVIFMASLFINEYFRNIHPQIKSPYILITHNGDENITREHIELIDDKIIHWYAQNVLVEHEKLTPIPIGLENKSYFLHGIPSYFDKLRSKMAPKQQSILYKFSLSTNPTERTIALATLEKMSLAETYTNWHEPYNYLQTLHKYSFVASPPGNGEDCIRTWEALYLMVVPIVQHSRLTEYFKSLGLPIWVVEDWRELENLTEEDLANKYEKLMENAKWDALYMDFWIKVIKRDQDNTLNRINGRA